MKTIKKFNTAEDATQIDTITQTQAQYGNPSITLYCVIEDRAGLCATDIVMVSDDGGDSTYQLLSDVEREQALGDTAAWLKEMAGDWADNTDDRQLEYLRWGLGNASDLAVADDYEGECKIIIEGNCYGYTPYNYASDDQGDPIIFDTPAKAQAWIDEAEDGRPTYTIVEA